MSLDPYSLCPCESGKKLKFCCADIAPEMVKALQLHEGGQSKAALKILEKLHEQDPGRAWVATSLSGVYLFLEQPEEARNALKALLETTPDHPLACILDATAALDLQGFEASRSCIHRAFAKGVKLYPEMIGSLAAGIASSLFEEGKYLAARQHLAFAMRFVRDEDRQQVFLRLLESDGEKSVPYPLRGVHNLKQVSFEGDEDKLFRKAVGLSAIGCWHEAAMICSSLLERHPDLGELWYNVGLFHAWDGNHAEASATLHKAATKVADRELAIAAETIAQLLDLEGQQTAQMFRRYQVKSLSRLLTQFDEEPRLQRVRSNEPQQENVSVTIFNILNREPDKSVTEIPDKLEELPHVIGVITCLDVVGQENSTSVHVILDQKQESEFDQWFGPKYQDSLELAESELASDSEFADWSDYEGFSTQYYLPYDAQPALVAQMGQRTWDEIINVKWPHAQLQGLNGKTPAEAKGNSELSIKLAAALYVLDAYADRQKYQLDLHALKDQYGVAQSEPYPVTDEQDLTSCDVMQMLRIPLEQLNDQQLSVLVHRAQLIQHSGFMERLLSLVLFRENVIPVDRMPVLWHAYVDLARDKFDRNLALERLQQAREWAAKIGQKFEETLQWEMRQLQFLVTDPKDEKIPEFLNEFHKKFLRKLPDLEQVIVQFLKEHNIEPTWGTDKSIVIAGSVKDVEQGNWSTAGSEAATPGKLWIPGQD